MTSSLHSSTKSQQLPLELVAANATYSIFIELMERCGLLEVYNNPMMLPLTVFMPTNEAFMSLYPGKLAELRDPMNIETLREYLKYHIISHRKVKNSIQFSGRLFFMSTLTTKHTVENK